MSRAIAWIGLIAAQLFVGPTRAEIVIDHRVEIGPPGADSRVPNVTAQGRFLAPQAVSALDVSDDGNVITVGTMAFSHDANVWQFGADGKVIAKRHLPPWAPLQVATLGGGRAAAVGLAYSRVTSPDPTVWFGPSTQLFGATPNEELVEADPSEGQLTRLRPGSGNWRTGWMASTFGELFARGPDWIFKPPRWWLDSEGRRHVLSFEDNNLLPTSRAMRMATSADGKRLAFGWLGLSESVTGLPDHDDAVSVWNVNPNKRLWYKPPSAEPPPGLPDPVDDFPEMASEFRLAADAMVPGHVAASVSLNRDGSRVAITEYGTWSWVRTRPAIGKWNPPIRALNFVPAQRGRLRAFDADGKELLSEPLSQEGMFEVAVSPVADSVWCWPASWFARGVAGAAWLPVDGAARTLYRVALDSRRALAIAFPDAIADCAVSIRGRTLVSCWDGRLYLLEDSGELVTSLEAQGPARLAWSHDGTFAVAGTEGGRLLRIDENGEVTWIRTIPVTEVPPLAEPPSEVVAGLPIYQGGRITGGEHAYVGDIWVIKSGNKGVIVDAGGTSGFAMTQARLRALGIEEVTHVLHTHSHGDHCGGAYLFRALGAKMVAPKSAELTLTWLMPMLSDYGIYPPRPVDLPLPLARVGDETEFEVSGLKFYALFVPGHSFDLTIYATELGGKRIAFTGDLGFEGQDMLHRCWGDAEKARRVLEVIRNKLVRWGPDVIFTGHGVRQNGMQFLAELVQQTEESLVLESRPSEAKPDPSE
jgi:glyoxylase-like metal-dependent hydrolase (beta-lactamase superfamily II)